MNRVFHVVALIAFCLVVAFGIVALTKMIATIPFPNDKGAEWLAAIGTIGTLIGTIWLATSESRRREVAAVQVGYLHAATMTLRLIRVRNTLDYILAEIEDVIRQPDWEQVKSEYVSLLQVLQLPTLDELVQMTALPQGVAAKLASASSQIEHALEFFSLMDRGVLQAELMKPDNIARHVTEMLTMARDCTVEGIEQSRLARKALGLAKI